MRHLQSIFYFLLASCVVLSTNTAVAGTKIYYVHNDHLATPKMMTDEQGTKVWEANHTPFGEATVEEDVDIDGELVSLNIRFPGQYYDQETGLHYNWNRYYDPSIGRYITSDPIGLDGGINTYGYVFQNPITYTDEEGLLSVSACANPANAAACAAAGIGSRSGVKALSRAILAPDKKSGHWVCNARADCNDNIEGNCPENPEEKFAFGTGQAKNLGDARNRAKKRCRP